MKLRNYIIAAAAMLMLAACSQPQGKKVAVVYYSKTGNTQAVAEAIAETLNSLTDQKDANLFCAELVSLTPVNPYPEDYQATIEESRDECLNDLGRELTNAALKDLDKYDVIFLGYPVWFGTYAQPIATVLATQDFKGKKVVPFCTFGSGGLESSVKNIQEKLPDAEILPGYGVRQARLKAAPAEVERFLMNGGFLPGEVAKLPDFSGTRTVTENEAAIFDAAVGDYPMIHAKPVEVASRPVPDGTEYLFTARDLPRDGGETLGNELKVYVLAEEGQDPVFTQVVH